jgi:hypothetical protein
MGKHIDGRHLGCSGSRSSSRKIAGGGPGAGGGCASSLSSAERLAQAGRAAGFAKAGFARWARNRRSYHVRLTGLASPATLVTSSRQEVSEPIGSGRSFRREQSRRRVPEGRKPIRSLARETSVGVASQGANPPGKRVRWRVGQARGGFCFGRARVVSDRPLPRGLHQRCPSPRRGAVNCALFKTRGTGFRRASGRARGWCGVQKSTSGAWPFA